MPLVTTTPGNYDDLISTTFQNYAPRIQDNFYNALALWHMLNKAGGVKFYDGGESAVIPVLFADNTTATALVSGYSDISVTPQNNVTVAQYLYRQYAVSVTISRRELLANNGPAQAISLLRAKSESAELALRNLLNTHAFSDSSAIPGAVLGLQEAFPNTLASGTVGGIAKATYSFWLAQGGSTSGDCSNAFGTNGRQRMATVYNQCSGGSSDHPTMIATNRSTYENYERTIEPIERLTPGAGTTGDPRFEMLKFRGALIFFDIAAPANVMYFLNPKYYFLQVHRGDHFYAHDFVKFPNQLGIVAQISWTGQIMISNMRRLGTVINCDTY